MVINLCLINISLVFVYVRYFTVISEHRTLGYNLELFLYLWNLIQSPLCLWCWTHSSSISWASVDVPPIWTNTSADLTGYRGQFKYLSCQSCPSPPSLSASLTPTFTSSVIQCRALSLSLTEPSIWYSLCLDKQYNPTGYFSQQGYLVSQSCQFLHHIYIFKLAYKWPKICIIQVR